MIPNPGEVLDTSTTNQNDGVFLQVMSDTRDVGGYLDPVREPDTSNFAKS
jgi:hypothetical protein